MIPSNSWLADDCGSVTAELAVVLPSVMAILGLALGALGLQVDRLRLVDETTQDAPAAARGETVDQAKVFASGNLICVKLSRPTPFGFELSDTECARREGT